MTIVGLLNSFSDGYDEEIKTVRSQESAETQSTVSSKMYAPGRDNFLHKFLDMVFPISAPNVHIKAKSL